MLRESQRVPVYVHQLLFNRCTPRLRAPVCFGTRKWGETVNIVGDLAKGACDKTVGKPQNLRRGTLGECQAAVVSTPAGCTCASSILESWPGNGSCGTATDWVPRGHLRKGYCRASVKRYVWS